MRSNIFDCDQMWDFTASIGLFEHVQEDLNAFKNIEQDQKHFE